MIVLNAKRSTGQGSRVAPMRRGLGVGTAARAGAPGRTGRPGDPNEDPFCSFWKGEDARVHAELCEVLDEAGVPHNTVFRRDRLFNLTNFPAYEIGVPFSLFEKAETAVKEAYGTDDIEEVGSRELQKLLVDAPRQFDTLPEILTPAESDDIPGPPAAGDETGWFEEDATAKAWRRRRASQAISCGGLA